MERTLLLVDDEENILAALTRVLRKEGYTILKAESGDQALVILSQCQVGVIISDQRMPGMTGTEFLTKAKCLYPDTVRIVLSGYTDLSSVTEAINQGAIYKYITKPWNDELVRADVREGFDRYEMKMENRRLVTEVKEANDILSSINKSLSLEAIKKTDEARLSLQVLRMSQAVLEEMPIGLLGIDPHGLVVVANKAAHRLLGNEYAGLVGIQANDVLPHDLCKFYEEEGMGEWVIINLPSNERVSVRYLNLHSLSPSQGAMLFLIPLTHSEFNKES